MIFIMLFPMRQREGVYIHSCLYVKFAAHDNDTRRQASCHPTQPEADYGGFSVVRRTKDEALETRNRLLDAAERLFSERGVSRTSLSDIAKAAGTTRGAIYWHFRDKSELFCAMIGRVTLPMEELRDRTAEQLREDPLGYIRTVTLGILERTATDARVQRVFDIIVHKCEYLDEMAEVKQRIACMREACRSRMEQAFRLAGERALIRPVDAHLAAISLQAFIDGIITNWLADRRYVSLRRDAAVLVDSYLAGLKVTAARPGGRHAPRKTRVARSPAKAQTAA